MSPVIIEYFACLNCVLTLLLGNIVNSIIASLGGDLNRLSLPNLEKPNSSNANAGTIPPSILRIN